MRNETDIDKLLEDLYLEGRENDLGAAERGQMMLNITPETGHFLDLLIRESRPKKVLEIGTSNGYSTIHIGRAAKAIGCSVDTVERAPEKVRMAATNLAEAQLQETVSIHLGDAGRFLSRCEPNAYDFVFLDSDRASYQAWGNALLTSMEFGTLVVDNATSHPNELVEFRRLIDDRDLFESVVLPIGKGQLVIRARPNGE